MSESRTSLTQTTSSIPDAPSSLRLTTAELLVLELVIAHRMLGVHQLVLSRDLWVRPQLDSLADRGLLTWSFDDNANFSVSGSSDLLGSLDATGNRTEVLGARITATYHHEGTAS